jgi:hypothetical protein
MLNKVYFSNSYLFHFVAETNKKTNRPELMPSAE